MAMKNPKGRANYEPNSWGPDEGGPREDPEKGFTHHEEVVEGSKIRKRSETFADHYSQARQFYISQTDVEQKHMADALTFELSKVETSKIRTRMLSHLLNIDKGLADKVAKGLGMDLPEPAKPAREPIMDLPASDPLSIIKNAPGSFAGRKLGIYVSDGTDAELLSAVQDAIKEEGGLTELVAPRVGGTTLSDGNKKEAKQKIDGGPSVLYDAVAILLSKEGCEKAKMDGPSRDFVTDAFVHAKFIAYTPASKPLLEKACIAEALDDGCVEFSKKEAIVDFIGKLGKLRQWDREPKVDMDG